MGEQHNGGAASLARTSGARRGCLRGGWPVYSCGERVGGVVVRESVEARACGAALGFGVRGGR